MKPIQSFELAFTDVESLKLLVINSCLQGNGFTACVRKSIQAANQYMSRRVDSLFCKCVLQNAFVQRALLVEYNLNRHY